MSFLNRLKYKTMPIIREPSFEECIDEFIKQYNVQETFNGMSRDKVYNAFIRMFCDKEEPEGNNFANQKKLIKLARKSGYETGYQMSNGRCVFINIFSEEGVNRYKDKEMQKIYVNCDRKNIANVAAIIFDNIKEIVGDKMQMKFAGEQILQEGIEKEKESKIKNYQRNDKIVICAENEEVAQKITEKINEIRKQKPEIFSSKKLLPFLPKKHGIMGISSEKNYRCAQTPLGIATGETYNDYISNVLYKCIISGFDTSLRTKRTQTLEERMKNYTKMYNNMTPEQKASVIYNIKKIFENVCMRNNVNTVYTKQNDNRKEFANR